MYNLVQNENMKIYSRVRTWILIVILLLVVAVQGAFTHSFTKKEENPNWKQELRQQNEELKKGMEDQEMPMPDKMKKSTLVEIGKNEYAIEHNIDPNQMTGWEFVEDATGLMTLITIFAAVIAGDIVASEFTWGTIKLLLIRPVSRTKILLSKYLATLLFVVLLCVILFSGSLVLGGLLFGFTGIDQPYMYADPQGNIQQIRMIEHIGITYGLEFISLLMIVTFAFMISATFRSSSLAISLSILLLFVGNVIVGVLSRYEWVKYILFANLDLNQYIEGTPVVEGMTFTFSVAMLVVYFLLFHAIAWTVFVKRDVTV